jgi:signal transduction histidine kinase
LEDILNSALDEVRAVLHVQVGWILLKGDGGRLKLAAARGFSKASGPDEIETVPEQCACWRTVEAGQSRVVDGSPLCLRGGLEVLQREGLDCHASVPLKAKEQVLGIMNLAYPADRQFGEDDLQLLNSVGQQIGMAVENARLYEDLRRKEAQLISAHEDERARVARELHDEAGQNLTALLLHLESLAEMLPPGADQAKRRLGELEAFTASIVQEMRRLMMDLRPTLLDDLGLIPAVRSFAESQLTRSGTRISVEVKGERRRLAPALEIALFRILQEAITNIAKHAQAAGGTVELCFQQSSVAACITDDGRGFDPVATRSTWQTFGLLGIEERVALLGGTLRIDSHENRGTRIALEIPTPPA